MNGSKKWYKSKTLWFGVLFGLVSIAGLFGFAEYEPTAEVTQVIGIVVAIGTVILRALTDTKLTR